MASRPLWKGSIGFGLVNIPVALHPGTEREAVDLDLLDRRDLSPIGYRKVNKTTGEEVPPAEIVKGFRLDSGEYVILTDEDLRFAAGERSRLIDIRGFVKPGEIRTAFYDTPYYLEATPQGDKGYALLREALVRTGLVGIAFVALRTRERLAAVSVDGTLLVLNLLRYPKEIRDASGLRRPGPDLAALASDKEVKLALRLVEEMAEPWKPELYHDRHREHLEEVVRRKAETGTARPSEAPARARRPAGTLMSLLEQSVSRAGRGRRASKSA